MLISHKKYLSADIVFVLDATNSTQCVFTGMIDYVSSIIFDITTKFRRAPIHRSIGLRCAKSAQ